MRGTYLLFLRAVRDFRIRVGVLGFIRFKRGCYVYVGSALSSLEKRIARHLRRRKKIRWHIDYLTSSRHVEVYFVFVLISGRRLECEISRQISRFYTPVKGFGSSDCRSCEAHLYYLG